MKSQKIQNAEALEAKLASRTSKHKKDNEQDAREPISQQKGAVRNKEK